MPRPSYECRFNADDVASRRRVSGEIAAFLAAANGEIRVSIDPVKAPGNTRTARQLRWYWPCVIKPLFAWMQANGWETTCEEDAHDELRRQFLKVPAKRDADGRPVRYRYRRTEELTPAEFGDYCEKCRDLLAKYCGINVPDPDPAWRERPKSSDRGPIEARNSSARRTRTCQLPRSDGGAVATAGG